jgi:hypothetical protein
MIDLERQFKASTLNQYSEKDYSLPVYTFVMKTTLSAERL